jgi:hypothetical protein
MEILILSILIGLVAGIIDIIPMLIKKLDKRATVSAFLQYLFLGIIIVNIDLPHIIWWLEGALISLAFTLPILLIVSINDKKSVPIITINSIILGTLIGIAGHFLK